MPSITLTNFGTLESTGFYITSVANGDDGWIYVGGSDGTNVNMNPVLKGYKDGILIWTTPYQDISNEEAINAIAFKDGFLYGAGYVYNSTTGSSGLLSKVDATTGNIVYTKLNNDFGYLNSIQVDQLNNVYIKSENNLLKILADGSTDWSTATQGSIISTTSSGITYAIAENSITKIDTDGTLINFRLNFQEISEHRIDHYPTGAITDSDGNLVVAYMRSDFSISYPSPGLYTTDVIKFDSTSGEIIWKTNFDSKGYAAPSDRSSLSIDKDGNLIVSGYTNSNLNGVVSNGDFDASIVKIFPDGSIVSTLLIGSSGYEVARQALYDQNGNLLIAGDFSSKYYSISGSGFSDIYLISDEGFVLMGDENNNLIQGGNGNDTIQGGLGNDELIGGNGNDTVNAGEGNDFIVGGDGAGDDSYNGGSGVDTVKYTSAVAGIKVDLSKTTGSATSIDKSSVDASHIGNDTLKNIENIIAGNFDDLIIGSSVSNMLLGEDGDDTLIGGAGKDTLLGEAGSDVLKGGSGNDVLTGGTGADQFVFDSALTKRFFFSSFFKSSSPNVDTITDFNHADGDHLALDHAIFQRFTAQGGVSADNLIVNTSGKAVDGNDYLIYNSENKTLYYDADGSGRGAAVAFVTLTGINTLSSNDLLIV